jgi:hypothetical protein
LGDQIISHHITDEEAPDADAADAEFASCPRFHPNRNSKSTKILFPDS